MRARSCLVLAAALLLAALATPAAAVGVERRLATDAGERRFIEHIPAASRGRRVPLVIVLHGQGGSGRNALEQGRWIAMADRAGFMLRAPDGVLEHPGRRESFAGNRRSWNSGPRTGSPAAAAGIDDIGFLRALIGQAIAEGSADADRVFATGFSNGAAMAFRVGAELSGLVAAIAPVANALLVDPPASIRPVSLLMIWGEADPLNPIAGGSMRRGGQSVTRPSGRDSFAVWARLLGCPQAREERPAPDLSLLAARGCRAGAEALFYRVAGLGHQWPGGQVYVRAVSGPGSNALNATEVIWAFFARNPRRP